MALEVRRPGGHILVEQMPERAYTVNFPDICSAVFDSGHILICCRLPWEKNEEGYFALPDLPFQKKIDPGYFLIIPGTGVGATI